MMHSSHLDTQVDISQGLSDPMSVAALCLRRPSVPAHSPHPPRKSVIQLLIVYP